MFDSKRQSFLLVRIQYQSIRSFWFTFDRYILCEFSVYEQLTNLKRKCFAFVRFSGENLSAYHINVMLRLYYNQIKTSEYIYFINMKSNVMQYQAKRISPHHHRQPFNKNTNPSCSHSMLSKKIGTDWCAAFMNQPHALRMPQHHVYILLELNIIDIHERHGKSFSFCLYSFNSN